MKFRLSLLLLAFASDIFCSRATAATGTIKDVQHVVIFMQENRSFDHYFGSMAGVQGFADPNAIQLATSTSNVFYQPSGKKFVLPFHITTQCVEDTDHSWGTAHGAARKGRWDQWVPYKTTTTMSYYNRADIPFHYALAETFTICDAYFCSVLGPSNPNRIYLWTGTIDPARTGGGPIIDNSEPSGGFTWTTYPERLQKAGVSWKVYQEPDNFDDNALAWFKPFINSQPGEPLFDRGMDRVSDLTEAFRKDVVAGTLPTVSWLVARTADSEHPSASPGDGAVITRKLLEALSSNPDIYNSTVFIYTFDENDGLFDHVPSPQPPANTTDEFVSKENIGLGVRVPTILISPWSRGGKVCSEIFDHTSILRFLELVTGVREPNISAWRRQVCGDLTSAFDFAHPDPLFPTLPAAVGADCRSSSVTPTVPNPQIYPTQEPGTKPVLPLPYQPNAHFVPNCSGTGFQFTMSNQGSSSVHLSIYANAYRTDGPWHYDLLPGTTSTATVVGVTNGLGRYDFSCYGPNRFQRRFAGTTNQWCGKVNIDSRLDLLEGAVVLDFVNQTDQALHFSLASSAGDMKTTNAIPVPAGQTISISTPAIASNDGWYDLIATLDEDTTFLRRFSGRLERWAPTLQIAVNPNGIGIEYPEWASAFTLESTSSLDHPQWSPVTTTPVSVNHHWLVQLPSHPTTSFFRLKP